MDISTNTNKIESLLKKIKYLNNNIQQESDKDLVEVEQELLEKYIDNLQGQVQEMKSKLA